MYIGVKAIRSGSIPELTYYKGFVETYMKDEKKKMHHDCPELRMTRTEAIEDAKELFKNLNH